MTRIRQLSADGASVADSESVGGSVTWGAGANVSARTLWVPVEAVLVEVVLVEVVLVEASVEVVAVDVVPLEVVPVDVVPLEVVPVDVVPVEVVPVDVVPVEVVPVDVVPVEVVPVEVDPVDVVEVVVVQFWPFAFWVFRNGVPPSTEPPSWPSAPGQGLVSRPKTDHGKSSMPSFVSFWLQAPWPLTQARTTTVPSVPKAVSAWFQWTVRPSSEVVSQTSRLSAPWTTLLQALSLATGATASVVAKTGAAAGARSARASIEATPSQPSFRMVETRRDAGVSFMEVVLPETL